MSLNLDFKVQKEQKVREIEDSLQNYKRDTRKLLWKLWDIVFWPEERDFARC